MSDETPARLERFLERTARKVSGGALHPLEILQRVEEAVDGAVADGVAPNDIAVSLSAADYRRYETALPQLQREIGARLDSLEQTQRLRRIGERRIAFHASATIAAGVPRIVVRFVDTAHKAVVAPGATQRIIPERNLVLALSDGRRVPVSHTPFNIGRGPENDLVIPSMAVSRRHAQLSNSTQGPILRDAGSRNGLVVDGERQNEVTLAPGVKVHLGDAWLSLEVSDGRR
jgi:Inner membrane component of T3SS, cytoplasmic domain/Protein of unknown function (DUF3662)